jgi:hypothetical protein
MNTRSITLYVVIAALLASVCFLLNAGFTGVDAQQPPPDQCRGKRTIQERVTSMRNSRSIATAGKLCVLTRHESVRNHSCDFDGFAF